MRTANARAGRDVTASRMKVSEAEWQWDRNKLTVYFTADKRVDFRALVQGDGPRRSRPASSCARSACATRPSASAGWGAAAGSCAAALWLPEIEPVTLQLAKDQGLSLNPAQISGACGRLMSCLHYEHEFYVQAKKRFPKVGRTLRTEVGEEEVVAWDIFRDTVSLRDEDGDVRTVPLEEVKRETASARPERVMRRRGVRGRPGRGGRTDEGDAARAPRTGRDGGRRRTATAPLTRPGVPRPDPPQPTESSGRLLSDHRDRLRERRPAHGPRVREDRRRRDRAVSPPARRRRAVRRRAWTSTGRTCFARPSCGAWSRQAWVDEIAARFRADVGAGPASPTPTSSARPTRAHATRGPGAGRAASGTPATSTSTTTRASTASAARPSGRNRSSSTAAVRSTRRARSRGRRRRTTSSGCRSTRSRCSTTSRPTRSSSSPRAAATRSCGSSRAGSRTSAPPARGCRGACPSRTPRDTPCTCGSTRCPTTCRSLGFPGRGLRALVAGRPARDRQGHHPLPLRDLAGDADVRRPPAARRRVGPRLREDRGRQALQVGGEAARARGPDRPARAGRVPLYPACARRPGTADRDFPSRGELSPAVRRTLPGRPRQRPRQPPEPDGVDGPQVPGRPDRGRRRHGAGRRAARRPGRIRRSHGGDAAARGAARPLMSIVRRANAWVDARAVALALAKDPKRPGGAGCGAGRRWCARWPRAATALQPFMPEKSAELWDAPRVARDASRASTSSERSAVFPARGQRGRAVSADRAGRG